MKSNLISRIKELSSPLEPKATESSAKLHKIAKLKAVVFDIYGTLFISSSGDVGAHDENRHVNAFAEALSECSIEYRETDTAAEKGSQFLLEEITNQHRKMQETGTEYPEINIKSVMEKTLSRLENLQLINSIGSDIESFIIEYEFRANQTWPMPELSESIKFIKNSGLALGIVSNAQFYTPFMIESHLGSKYLDFGFSDNICIWSYLEQEGKPSLNLYKKLAENLHDEFKTKPQETLYVGNDMLKDIWAASQCGFKTALFAGDTRSLRLRKNDLRCKNLMPDIVLTELKQLRDVIDG